MATQNTHLGLVRTIQTRSRKSVLSFEQYGEGFVFWWLQPIVLRVLNIIFSLNNMESVGMTTLGGTIWFTFMHYIAMDYNTST